MKPRNSSTANCECYVYSNGLVAWYCELHSIIGDKMEGQQVIAENNKEYGNKHDSGKPRMDLLSPIALEEIAKVMTFGATKYGDNNWRKGLAWSRVLGAALRHIFAFIRGEDVDGETGFSHLSHASCCLMFLLEYESTRREFDDRYKSRKSTF